jgi:phenylacetate-CoA ligase
MKHSTSPVTSLAQFISTPLADRLSRDRLMTARDRLLALFQAVARDVPAYQKFLAVHGVNVTSIATIDELTQVPLVTKQNYIHAYSLPDRCWGGSLKGSEIIAVSSGSTGKPVAWPRSLEHELDVATRFEQAFAHSFGATERTTLVVVCFPLGTWVGGMYTAQCCRYVIQKGYPLTLVTPGNNPAEIYRVMEEIAPDFEQVVLAGYPPFIKEVIDNGISRGISWKRHRVKMLLAGEVFSEEWRSLVCERLGAEDPRLATVALYGTADAGVLGNETPLSINIRRFFAGNPEAAREVFGESRLPALLQYDPCSRFFESHEGTLVVSGDNGVPLIRYHIADKGGVFEFDALLKTVRRLGGNPMVGIDAGTVLPLPFVYLFGRADFTVSYFGANVFPENVSVGLEQLSVRSWVSGKFVLQVVETPDHGGRLHIDVELAPGVQPSAHIAEAVGTEIREQLLRLNSEFAHYVPHQHQQPHVELRSNGDPDFFPRGVKHRYTRK